MTWHFSDGTVAKVGGEIEGGTAFAQELRRLIAQKPLVQVRPIPDEATRLDVDDIQLMDRFLRNEMVRPCNSWMMLRLIKAPEVAPLEVVTEELDEDALY